MNNLQSINPQKKILIHRLDLKPSNIAVETRVSRLISKEQILQQLSKLTYYHKR